jgi:orotidine-5'-phosphate decarboxylase
VTPGVRSAGAAQGDQKRVATPAQAIQDGADYLVMGRQITRAVDPAGELARVLEEIARAAG